jgi:hypothetical protein
VRYADVASELIARVPAFEPVYREHLEDNDGELLPHVLFGDLSRFVVSADARGDDALVRSTLDFLENVLTEGDEAAQNLVVVSFVENIARDDLSDPGQVDEWPPNLRAWHRRVWGSP